MAEKYIRINGKLVAVTEDVYYTYYHMGRQCRTQAEKDGRRRVASYDALDTEDSLGVELLVDELSPSVEEIAITHILTEKLNHCFSELSMQEQKVINALYFRGMSEREAAKVLGIHHMTVHNRKINALQKLRKMIDK